MEGIQIGLCAVEEFALLAKANCLQEKVAHSLWNRPFFTVRHVHVWTIGASARALEVLEAKEALVAQHLRKLALLRLLGGQLHDGHMRMD